MSLETALENHSVALKELTEAVLFVGRILNGMHGTFADAPDGENSLPEKEIPAPEIQKSDAKPKPTSTKAKPKVQAPEPEPESEAEAEEVDDLCEYEDEMPLPATEFKLPAGKRDAAYYEKHVYPHTAKLQTLDKDALIRMVKVEFKSPRGGREVAPERWDEMVLRTQELIADAETLALVGS